MADPFSFAIATIAQIGISYLFPSSGPRLKDLKVSASTYGAAIPITWGNVRTAGNLIWSSGIREKKRKSLGGKGGFVTTYTYSADFSMAFAQGPVTEIRKIWADSKLIYDSTANSTVQAPGGGLIARVVNQITNGKYDSTFYYGDELQTPDPIVEAALGAGNAPAHRGMVYVVFKNFQLADYGNRLPQMAAELFTGGPPTQPYTPWVQNQNNVSGVNVDFRGEIFADPARGVYYTYDAAHTAIRQFRYSDATLQRTVLSSATGITSQGGIYDNGLFSRILAVLSDGSLIVTSAGAPNYAPIWKLDAFSLSAVAVYGHAASFPDDGTIGTAILPCAANGLFYGHLSTPWQTVDIFDAAGVSFIKVASYSLLGAHPRLINSVNDGSPAFWVLNQTSFSFTFDLLELGGAGRGVTVSCPPSIAHTFAFVPYWFVYDAQSPGWIIGVQCDVSYYLFKISLDTMSLVWTLKVPGIPINYVGPITNGVMPLYARPNLLSVDTLTGTFIGTVVSAINPNVSPEDTPVADYTSYGDASSGVHVGLLAGEGQAYDPSRQMLVLADSTSSEVDAIIPIGRTTGGATTLAQIVGDLLRMSILTDKDFDLTALESTTVKGYGFASGTDVKSILDELRRIYLFDLVESDGVLVASIRGVNTSVETIYQKALGSTSPDASDFWKETRTQEADLPEKITLSYMNSLADFEVSTAVSKRISNPVPTMFSRQQVAIEANIVMDPTEAKTQVNKMLYTQWSERTMHETRLPWAYLNLDPADVITVIMTDGRNYEERMHLTEIGADFNIKVDSYGQDSGQYDITVIGDGGTGGQQQTIASPRPAVAILYNGPLLRDQDDGGGTFSRYYAAVGNGAPRTHFTGATMYRSLNDIDFAILFAKTNDAEWGSVGLALQAPSHGPFAMDWVNTVTIYPVSETFELEPCTDDELWNGANMCLIGNEVLQFRDCEQNSDGSWMIWNLARGRRGTEWATDKHTGGEKFVFLDTNTIELAGDTLDSAGQLREFKAVGDGFSSFDTAETKIIYYPRDLYPLAPNNINRERLSDHFEITWTRRNRFGGNMMDGTGEVPMNEATEKYEVYLMNAPFATDFSINTAPTTFMRSYTPTTPEITYTDAQMTADGFDANLDTLYVVVYQVSAVCGRGFPGYRVIEPWRDT